ncbi:MAG: phage late control D family protein [Desulfobacteraceae bacterium]|nr:phage late control D family protein [Desulfobacteraceae bacterium]
MPFGHAQIFMQLQDFDKGDEDWYGQWLDMWQVINERIIKFEFSDHVKKIDQLKLTLRNDDYEMLENPVFVKGQKILATWGWPGQTKVPRRMIVHKVKGGNPLTVTMHDTSRLLDKQKKSRTWEGVTHSEVVREIAGEYGYLGPYLHVEETDHRSDVVQNYKTDARFVARLARKNGFEFYVDASGMHWHKRKLGGNPVKSYIYRTDPVRGDIIEEPSVDVNLARVTARVKVVARDPYTKQLWEVFGGPDDTEVDALGFEDVAGNPEDPDQGLRASRLARVDVRYAGILTEQEAQLEADARYREVVNKRFKMSLSVIGDGRIGAKVLVDVYGVAPSYDGLFYVKECVDEIEGGHFVQRLKLEKNSLRKVPASKRRRKGKKEKTNPDAGVLRIEEQTIRVVLRSVRKFTTDPDGEPVLANYFVDEGGTRIGDVDYETSAFFDPEKDFGLFADQGAQSVPPDEGQ